MWIANFSTGADKSFTVIVVEAAVVCPRSALQALIVVPIAEEKLFAGFTGVNSTLDAITGDYIAYLDNRWKSQNLKPNKISAQFLPRNGREEKTSNLLHYSQ